MMPKFVILLLSGGMDSVVLLYYLRSQGCEVHCLLIDYGQRHQKELVFAKRHCERLSVPFTIISIPTLQGSSLTDSGTSVVVPWRNAVMLSLAVNLAVAAKADSVAYGCNQDDAENFPDCRPEFVRAFNATVRAAELNVEVCAPFIDKNKAWIGGLGQELGVPLGETWSCYEGAKDPCGVCPACLKRNQALAA